MNESISTSAGAQHGQFLSPADLRRIIREAGRTPAQRRTNYELVKVYTNSDDAVKPLDCVADANSEFGSYHNLIASQSFRFKR